MSKCELFGKCAIKLLLAIKPFCSKNWSWFLWLKLLSVNIFCKAIKISQIQNIKAKNQISIGTQAIFNNRKPSLVLGMMPLVPSKFIYLHVLSLLIAIWYWKNRSHQWFLEVLGNADLNFHPFNILSRRLPMFQF